MELGWISCTSWSSVVADGGRAADMPTDMAARIMLTTLEIFMDESYNVFWRLIPKVFTKYMLLSHCRSHHASCSKGTLRKMSTKPFSQSVVTDSVQWNVRIVIGISIIEDTAGNLGMVYFYGT